MDDKKEQWYNTLLKIPFGIYSDPPLKGEMEKMVTAGDNIFQVRENMDKLIDTTFYRS